MGYVTPEQIADGTSDGRADLFALGAVMHEALTGRRVFAGGNDLATLLNVMEKPVEPPSSVNPGVGEKLDWIVLRALRRDPRQRFASAADMGRALEGYLRAPDTEPGAQAVRDLIADVDQLFRRAQPPAIPAAARAAAAPPRRTEGNTLAVDDAEIVAIVDDATPPPLPTAVVSRSRARRRRRALLAAGAVALLTVVVGRGLATHHPVAGAVAVAGPGANTAPTAAVVLDRVQIVIDSSPQGALVAHDPQSTPIGETPLLLDLPRGQAPLSFWVRKPGYEPVAYKLIPSASQPVMVRLQARGADDPHRHPRPGLVGAR
jgi:eukaryotic-like serine/threonine-protein kinase